MGYEISPSPQRPAVQLPSKHQWALTGLPTFSGEPMRAAEAMARRGVWSLCCLSAECAWGAQRVGVIRKPSEHEVPSEKSVCWGTQ